MDQKDIHANLHFRRYSAVVNEQSNETSPVTDGDVTPKRLFNDRVPRGYSLIRSTIAAIVAKCVAASQLTSSLHRGVNCVCLML
uniref:Uncharacterized protein n=1 Tax=Ascaris lumbricoides TaxID=6252 RepID=A0A0M3IXC0_ASCLU